MKTFNKSAENTNFVVVDKNNNPAFWLIFNPTGHPGEILINRIEYDDFLDERIITKSYYVTDENKCSIIFERLGILIKKGRVCVGFFEDGKIKIPLQCLEHDPD